MKNRLISMIGLLSIQFILGMAVNLFGTPPDESSVASISFFSRIIFISHSIAGLLLVIGSVILTVMAFKANKPQWKKSAVYGLLSIVIAAGGGIATVVLKDSSSEVGSFVMAIGFLLSLIVYGRFYYLVRKD